MSVLPYALLRPVLFALDAETAHDFTLRAMARLQSTPLQWTYAQRLIEDPVDIAGLRFPNRVGLAAGLDKNANCVDALGALGFGFVEVGTVTPMAQAGNPRPRMFRLPKAQALINRMGFNNAGLSAFLANLQGSRLRRRGQILGLNIGKNASTPVPRALDDYRIGLAGVYAAADYVTVNISSPNTKDLRALQSDRALDELLAGLAQQRELLSQQLGRRVPIFIKIAPDLDGPQIAWIADCLQRHGMDGVIATNTTTDRAAVAALTHGAEAGGLSGAPLMSSSNRVVRQLRTALGPGYPIIGVGGIMSGADAQAKIEAGADAVQIYTGLIYRGPALVKEIASLLKQQGTTPRPATP